MKTAQHKVCICVRLLKVDKTTVCIEFKKVEGDQMQFYEHFVEFRDQVLKDYNDL